MLNFRFANLFLFPGPFVLTGILASLSLAQQPPVPPNPQAPTLAMSGPMGMQRGTSLEITLTGTNLAGPTKLWTSFSCKATFPTDNNNGADNAKLRVRLEVPKDAPIGFHTIRLATTRGLSNFRLFCIDQLEQVMKVDNNRTKETAQAVPVPCVVVGRVDAEANAYFKITVKAGQRVSFEVLGRRLGSALDPRLTLIDPRTGKELPDGMSDDAPGLQTDPRLTYTFKEAGDYLIEVRDTTYRGGPDYWYRLRIGDFPCATTPIPMAAKRGSKASLTFAGPTVDNVAPLTVMVPPDPTRDVLWVTPEGKNGLLGWPVPLGMSDLDDVVEQEPNGEKAKANRVPVPGAVTGRFQEKGDVDYFVFAAKKGQRYIIEAQTHEFSSPTEVFLVLKNSMGQQILTANPSGPPKLDFTAPADGDFFLAAEHLLYWGGPAESYRVTITPYEPGFDLSLGIDRYDIPVGASVAINVSAARRDFNGPIEINVLGVQGISGRGVIHAFPITNPQPGRPNQPTGMLFVTAGPDVPIGPYNVVIQGKAIINGKTVVRYASVRTVVMQNLGNLPYPPGDLFHQIGLAVIEKPPFTLASKLDLPEASRGIPATVTVTAKRTPGFNEEIALTPLGLPANLAPAMKNIPKGQNEVKIHLTPAANAPLAEFTFSFAGKAKFQNKDFAVTGTPAFVTVVVPFALQIDPLTLRIAQGMKSKIKITALRKGGYQGPITLELRSLPANVTSSKVTLDKGQTTVEMEITAAANAVLGDKPDVTVQGVATGAANQQVSSSNFKVTVLKK